MVKRILIADDSFMIRRQVRLILELDDTVEVCAEAIDGADAVQKVCECCPDLAILDVAMPKMNGLEATRKIKMLMPGLPVLLFTLHDSPELEWESRRVGADAILAKSDGSAKLSRVVHSLLRERPSVPVFLGHGF
ncbi:MAG: response regulator transcription factor [Terriglobales bacterium]|jgi:DNA-binding NarL/FixJ family response regulator